MNIGTFVAVLRGVEHLFGREQRGIEIHRGGFIERRCAAGDVVFVDRGGRDVVGQRIVKLRIVLLAVETAHRADGRKFDLAYEFPVETVLADLALRMFEIGGEKIPTGRADALQQLPAAFGNHGRNLRRVVQVHLHQRVVRRVAVGHVIELAVPAFDGRVVGVEARQQGAEFRLGNLFIEHFRTRRTLRSHDEEPLPVLAGPRAEITQRMLRVGIDQPVGRLGRAEAVVVDLLKLVLRRENALLRSVVRTVIESFGIGRPLGSRKLHPVDPVRSQRTVGGVHHTDFDPVRTRCGDRVGAVFAVLGEGHARKGHRTVFRERIGVDEHFALPARLRGAVEHRLVPQSVVVEIIPCVAVFGRNTLFGVVPQFGQPFADRAAERNLRQVILRHDVLGLHPRRRRLRVVVFEPAVGIGNLRPEVIIGHVGALRPGIGHVFYLFHVAAACQYRRGAREGRRHAR